jgi:hypothetical protein
MKETMSQHPGHSFQRVLQEFASARNLESAERAHVGRWINDGRADDIWSVIAAGMRKGNRVIPDEFTAIFFIGEVLAMRGFAHHPGIRVQYLERAKDAERLANFLVGVDRGLPPPLPDYPNYEQLALNLRELAKRLRDQDARRKEIGLLRTSRKRGTAPRLTFIRLVSNLLTEICGRPLDREVAFLTQIAFSDREIDVNLVRHARQPATSPRRGAATRRA